MQIAGVVCEYNPFHRGHALHLAETRARVGDLPVVAVMSGAFVQRGEPALLAKHARAEMALRGGADLVLELPTAWALASAERFALGGVAVLAGLGLPAVLSFGSERGELTPLARAAEADLASRARIKALLREGYPYAKARELAVAERLGPEAALLREPNNLLGVEYCKAIHTLGCPITPLTVPRQGTAHDGAPVDALAPASAIRALLRAGEEAAPYLPPESLALIRREQTAGRAPVDPTALETALLACLRTLTDEDYVNLPDSGEGLWRRLAEAGRREPSLEAVLNAVKTKRYAHSRLRRMLAAALLGIRAEDQQGLPPYIRVLGHNARGRAVLHAARKTARLPLITKPAAARSLSPEAARLFALDVRAASLQALAYPDPAARWGQEDWRTDPIVV